jgi:imidazolonepropionase-like amidohydrolase
MRTVFGSANLVDGDNPVKSGQSIVVEGNLITAVGPDASIELRPDDIVHDLGGKSVMPSMTQGHWHGTYDNVKFVLMPGGLEKHPSYLAFVALNNAQRAMSQGYTSVIGAATGECLDAQLKRAINDNIVEGPRIMACGHWLITTGEANDYDEHWWWGITAMGVSRVCDGPQEFLKAVREEIKQGAEVIKLYTDEGHLMREGGKQFVNMTEEETRVVIETAHSRGVKVRSHIDNKAAMLQGLRLDLDLFDHADELDEELIEKMVEANAYVCPSIVLPRMVLDHFAEATHQRAFNAQVREAYESMCKMLPIAAKAGLRVMFGDDWRTFLTPHGDYWKEFKLYADAGVPNIDIIRWATKHPQQFIGVDDKLGTVAAGKLADLLVIDGDPLADISVMYDPANVLAVMKDGKFYRNSLPAPETQAFGQPRLATG